jgi:hypothetical protein
MGLDVPAGVAGSLFDGQRQTLDSLACAEADAETDAKTIAEMRMNLRILLFGRKLGAINRQLRDTNHPSRRSARAIPVLIKSEPGSGFLF